MAPERAAVVVQSLDPEQLSLFWAQLLGCGLSTGVNGSSSSVVGIDDSSVLEFLPSTALKSEKNRQHLDVASESEKHQAALVECACGLGAQRVDIGQTSVPWVVLADPEGNEFCVLEPRDEYSGSGPIAAVVTDAVDPLSTHSSVRIRSTRRSTTTEGSGWSSSEIRTHRNNKGGCICGSMSPRVCRPTHQQVFAKSDSAARSA
ncbi:MAG: VOC family protein [Mycobacterium sp.]